MLISLPEITPAAKWALEEAPFRLYQGLYCGFELIAPFALDKKNP